MHYVLGVVWGSFLWFKLPHASRLEFWGIFLIGCAVTAFVLQKYEDAMRDRR